MHNEDNQEKPNTGTQVFVVEYSGYTNYVIFVGSTFGKVKDFIRSLAERYKNSSPEEQDEIGLFDDETFLIITRKTLDDNRLSDDSNFKQVREWLKDDEFKTAY